MTPNLPLRRTFVRGAAVAGLALHLHAAMAQSADFDIPAQPLAPSLATLARQAGLQLAFSPDLAQGRQAHAVRGRKDVQQALAELLQGSGLQGRIEGRTLVVEKTAATGSLAPVTVTANAGNESATGPVYGYIARRSSTATKTDTAIAETPQSISVITSELMEAQGVQRVEQALRYSAGIRAEPIFDTRRGAYYIRGFKADQTSQYLDSLKLPHSGGYGGWEIEPYSLERLEILRGPASVLYGQSAPGGMVNQVSKRPQEVASGELNLDIGNFDRRQASLDLTGPLDADGTLLYRLTALGRESNTQTDYVKDNRLFVSPQITWKPNADTQFTLYAQGYKDKSGNSANFLPASGTLTPLANGLKIPVNLFTGEPGYDQFDRTQQLIGYELSHKVNDALTLRQNLRYGEMKVDYLDIGANSSSGAPLVVGGRYALRRIGLNSRERYDLFTLDNQAQWKLSHGAFQHTLLAGVDYQKSTYDQRRGLLLTGGTSPEPALDIFAPVYGRFTPVPRQNTTSVQREQIGFYAQDQVRMADRWVLQLAGRYDKAKVSTQVLTYATGGLTYTATDDERATGRAGLLYETESGFAPYVSVSTSFEPTASTAIEGGGAPKPTTGKQYEAGVKFQPKESRSFGQLAVFDLRQQNVLTTGSRVGLASQVGEIRARGVELEGTWAVTPRFNLVAALTHLDAEITKAGSLSASTVGLRPQLVASDVASLWADYRFADGPLRGLKLGAGVRYTGPSNDQTGNVKVPGFTLVDLLATYDIDKRYRLSLNVSNLFDRKYVAGCDSAVNCYYGNRRTVTGSLTYRW